MSEENLAEKADITNVIKVKKVKEEIKADVEEMIETQKISRWSSIREIIQRRTLKKLSNTLSKLKVFLWKTTFH